MTEVSALEEAQRWLNSLTIPNINTGFIDEYKKSPEEVLTDALEEKRAIVIAEDRSEVGVRTYIVRVEGNPFYMKEGQQ